MNVDELWCTTALIYVDNGQYFTVSWRTPDKEVRPSLYTVVPNSYAVDLVSSSTIEVTLTSRTSSSPMMVLSDVVCCWATWGTQYVESDLNKKSGSGQKTITA